jgi:electron transport complex protein RnfG
VESFEVVKGSASSDNQIEAISGATITSRAVTGGMNAAIAYAVYLMNETGGELINE